MKPLSLVLALAPLGTPLAAQTRGYYRTPTIHGDTIVFCAEGDLWKVGVEGGVAARLTRDDGAESMPRFSPDGAWLAFSGSYEGNVDVYVAPAAGGEPRRLTWHPDADEVIGWTPDSRAVVFRGRRASAHGDYRLFTVALAGGMPEMVDIGMAALADWTPDGRTVAFNRFPRENRTWKRYYGGTQQDVWVGDLERGTFERITEDWIAGRDPQLERGIQELLRRIAEEPVGRPEPPPVPDKSRGRLER